MSEESLRPSGIILYQTENGRLPVRCRFGKEKLWLTQVQMAALCQTGEPNINLHVKKICAEKELDENTTIGFYVMVRLEHKWPVSRLKTECHA